jgi:hypothetical protein
MRILDLGCGPNRKMPGSIGLDKRPAPHVDVVHDLNAYPYPFADDEFDYIEMSHIIEHIDRPASADERGPSHRERRSDHQNYYAALQLPAFVRRPGHYHHLGWITFSTLQNTGLFKIARHKLWSTDIYKVLGISLIANWFPRRWEKYFAFMFPALYIEVFLTVMKKAGGRNLIKEYMY